MKALVITCSNRAAAGVYEDTTGPMIVQALREWGFDVDEPLVVPDGPPVEEALREAVDLRHAAVVTTGGTGISPTDATPEATANVLDRELPGVAEAIRAYGVAHGVPTAMLSRGRAGVADQTVVVNLPGSRGGVRDGLAVLADVLVHAVEQVAGVDHVRDAGGAS
ncbi:MogA/MoaB family molybdenum cofactor biosynthesis protein [Mumia sp. zg.B53]|uniref:MogA/MoaB family molybdenum cofactor biosynthesis protein n=1 Tax=unclassified Mumia TaxID=2621872 RepID=UPI001C6ED0CA|nr:MULTISPECIES: MogA/MoaB family molybdenum cofactor biosynthesis protein [unclassified Mumia]MBW9206951.1 MogA/MoaB family molybdenum cofactor biosynthesis protein [Mumia sp. zg.B17]MBW9210716.1 MogA/MoaB family molybdenum cofactor biosynthesis protein [Mumia sp. zg.B21]MBW9215330.1 MogA/MoaB family molybdenum cofactor biosynthesis protein [Mumia sp. zg.B53]MDD9349981.1 MogA/MoaB family molybdenum cofactor biosynthesis protein [Mumia sp.]